MVKTLLTTAILAIAAVTAAPAPPPRVSIIHLPDGGLQPRAVLDTATGIVHVSYFKGDPAHGDVFYAVLRPGGAFDAPARVNDRPGSAIATGNVRGPRLALGRNARAHVAWIGSDRAPRSATETPVLYSRRRADGSFEPERTVRRLPGPADGASIAADRNGHVYVMWHAELPAGKGEQDRRAWVAASADDGASFAAERSASAAEAGACGCCGTEGLVDRRGTLYLLFRSARENVHRETTLLTSSDHAASFDQRNLQEWTIAACPMSTYALAEADGRVDAAWETAGQIYWSPVGASGGGAAPIPAPGAGGTRKHPAIAINAHGDMVLAWTEGMAWGRGGTVAWQAFDKNGASIGPVGHADGVPAWSLVAAVARNDGSFTIIY